MVRKFREVDAQGMFVGTPMVAKESRFQDDMALEDRRQFHRVFCETQHQAQVIALEFNKRLAAIPDVDCSTPRITFLDCSICRGQWYVQFRIPGGGDAQPERLQKV